MPPQMLWTNVHPLHAGTTKANTRFWVGLLTVSLISICFVFFDFLADGVGNIQQSGLCRPHLPEHERVGVSVETGDILSVQLLVEVSVRS